MSTSFPDYGLLGQLQSNPLDLRRMNAADAARALFDFIQRTYDPGDECSLWSPQESDELGYGPYWHVSWEAGPAEWGVLLSLGESMWLREFGLRYEHRPEVMLESGQGWYTEPYHGFDVGFIETQETCFVRILTVSTFAAPDDRSRSLKSLEKYRKDSTTKGAEGRNDTEARIKGLC